ncbi:hypothetical protein G6F59_018988 [Rhizopus arrhizus]|nr:hypothetical protein G6F59_018988 [Rhizopus arrhizus]
MDPDLAAMRIVNRVDHEIGQHLLESQRVNQHVRLDARIHFQQQAQPLLTRKAIEHTSDGFDLLAQAGPRRGQAQAP